MDQSGCLLRAIGEHFDVDAYLAANFFDPSFVWHKGVPVRPHSKHTAKTTGLELVVSTAAGDFPRQVTETMRFLDGFEKELRALVESDGIERVWLTFALPSTEESYTARVYFPPVMLHQLGALGIALEIEFRE